MTRQFISAQNCPHYQTVNEILEAAMIAVDPYLCTQRFIHLDGDFVRIGEKEYSLAEIANIYVIGMGKAVLPMTKAAVDVLGDHIQGGVVIGKHADPKIMQELPASILVRFGDHPLPASRSMESAKILRDFTGCLTERDLVICLISGGGSALMSLPVEEISMEEMQEVTHQLLFSGATINEVNAVRKHLEQLKGGNLARQVKPANLATLVLSDVIGDTLDAIASGPTVSDNSTFADVMEILAKYNLEKNIPKNIDTYIKAGVAGSKPETVKPDDPCLKNSYIAIIGSLTRAIEAAEEKAKQKDFITKILTTELIGEAHIVGMELGEVLENQVKKKKPPTLLLAGGETTVTVKGQGKGGRNQETALSAALQIRGLENCLFISLATDGEDGPTDAAGGAVNGQTITQGSALGMNAQDYIKHNDAYHYLERVNALIKIGPTGTNVNDLLFLFTF